MMSPFSRKRRIQVPREVEGFIALWSQKAMSNDASANGVASALAGSSENSAPQQPSAPLRARAGARRCQGRSRPPHRVQRDRPLCRAAAQLEDIGVSDVTEDL